MTWVDMSISMGVDMCVDICVDMCIDMFIDICTRILWQAGGLRRLTMQLMPTTLQDGTTFTRACVYACVLTFVYTCE